MPEVTVKTASGDLKARAYTDPDHPSLDVFWGDTLIAVIEPSVKKPGGMRLLVYDKRWEEPTHTIELAE